MLKRELSARKSWMRQSENVDMKILHKKIPAVGVESPFGRSRFNDAGTESIVNSIVGLATALGYARGKNLIVELYN